MHRMQGRHIEADRVECPCRFCGGVHEYPLPEGARWGKRYWGPRNAPCNGQEFLLYVEINHSNFR